GDLAVRLTGKTGKNKSKTGGASSFGTRRRSLSLCAKRMRDKARGLRQNGGYGMIGARKGGFIVNQRRLKMLTHKLLEGLSLKMFALILLGAAISTFGIHHIHQ